MTTDELETIVSEFRVLLDNPTGEHPVQRFLEKHPYLISAGTRHVHADVVISQFPLGSDFIPDFAFVTWSSGGTYLELIEIEKPNLAMFTESDEFTQPYNKAFQQLQDWVQWCEKNQQSLVNMLEPLFQFSGMGTHFIPECKLIAGRRNELISKRRRERFSARNNQLPKGLSVTTFDGFLESLAKLQILSLGESTRCVSYRSQDFFEKAISALL